MQLLPVKMQNSRQMATISYWLYILGMVLPICHLAGIVLAYIYRDDAKGTYLESHYTYLIRTFWIGFLYSCIAFILFIVLIGYFLLLLIYVWLLVRAAKGLKALSAELPIENEKTWFF